MTNQTDYILSEDEFNTIAKCVVISQAGELDEDSEWQELYIDEDSEITVTRDSFDDFRVNTAHNWNECAKLIKKENDGVTFFHSLIAQPRKGDPRQEVIIVDLGEKRAVYFF